MAQRLHDTVPVSLPVSCPGVVGEQCRLTQDTGMTAGRRYMHVDGWTY